MPALNFQAQFADDVADGTKQQSIRAPRRDGRVHCKVGDTLKLYTGMRTKSCRLLGEGRVTGVRDVRIEGVEMWLNGLRLPTHIYSRDQLEPTDNEFAQADGFEDFMDMRDWFSEHHGLPFEGVCIEWELIR
ncbi:MAG: hypothetical protein AAGG72_00045 [Pseudomonadota bacterium]